MKKLMIFFLTVLLLLPLLSACREPAATAEQMKTPVDFFYRRREIGAGDANSVLGIQTVDFGDKLPDTAQMLERYLDGPTDDELDSPFPKGTVVLSVSVARNTVSLQMGGTYADLNGINASVADACLCKTLLKFEAAEKIVLSVADQSGVTARSVSITDSDILLLDDSSDTSSTSVTLYFTDENGRYLIPEKRTVPYLSESERPKYLVNQLLSGPETNGLKKTLPYGTRLLDINVDNGVCAVDFSADFVNNRPQSMEEERLAVLSVVNTLTVLDSVELVQFYVEGNRQEQYSFLPLSGQFVQDNAAVGPVRGDLNETDATLYLPAEGSGLLYAVPVRAKTASGSVPEAVLRLLSEYEPKNGLTNPMYGKPLPQNVSVEDSSCVLDYPEGTVFGENFDTELATVRTIVATTTASDGIRSVRIFVGGAPAVFSFIEAAENLKPMPEWYCGFTE